jgi:hypothetical protein
MDTMAKHVSDDQDLDALMVRVREAAMAGTSGSAARPQTAGDAQGADADLIRVLDAQAEWNEHTRQSLAALVDCLRTLRDDWANAHARLREDVTQLAALVDELENGRSAAVTKSNRLAAKSKRPHGASGSARTPAKRRSSNGGRRRS